MSTAWAQAKREQAAHKKANETAAMKLDTLGMEVEILLDSGERRITKLTTRPWTLGHGIYVAKVEGVSGGYDCTHITPVGKAVAA